jgi:hypothetical protein
VIKELSSVSPIELKEPLLEVPSREKRNIPPAITRKPNPNTHHGILWGDRYGGGLLPSGVETGDSE